VATKYVSIKVKLGDENDTTTDVSFASYKSIAGAKKFWCLLD
jgi:hypothetical protein